MRLAELQAFNKQTNALCAESDERLPHHQHEGSTAGGAAHVQCHPGPGQDERLATGRHRNDRSVLWERWCGLPLETTTSLPLWGSLLYLDRDRSIFPSVYKNGFFKFQLRGMLYVSVCFSQKLDYVCYSGCTLKITMCCLAM